MCMSVCPNDVDKGESPHLSVLLHIMKGSYDDYLLWPLIAMFDLILLSQIDSTEHRICKVQFDHNNRVINGERGEGQGRQICGSLDKKLLLVNFSVMTLYFLKYAYVVYDYYSCKHTLIFLI